MRTCKDCGAEMPWSIEINGKIVKMGGRRTRCYGCVPYKPAAAKRSNPVWTSTDETFQAILDQSSSFLEVFEKLGLEQRPYYWKELHDRISEKGFSLLKLEENRLTRPRRASVIEPFTSGTKKSGATLTRWLLNAGVPYCCDECGIAEWNGKPLTLQVDHEDGVNTNHARDNLRFLCPNCHTQTGTFAGRNIRHLKGTTSSFALRDVDPASPCLCVDCKTPVSKEAQRCAPCERKQRLEGVGWLKSKIPWPTTEALIAKLRETAYIRVAAELGVSDNAVRKHLERRGFDPKTLMALGLTA